MILKSKTLYGVIRSTQLVKDGPHAEALAQEWRRRAKAVGWV
jgi:hypothetical protein